MWKADLDSKVLLPNGKPIPAVLLANKVGAGGGVRAAYNCGRLAQSSWSQVIRNSSITYCNVAITMSVESNQLSALVGLFMHGFHMRLPLNVPIMSFRLLIQ